VEPRVAGGLERGEPGRARLAAVLKRGKHGSGDAPLGEQVVHAALNRQPRKPAKLVAWPVHDHVDAGHHPGGRDLEGGPVPGRHEQPADRRPRVAGGQEDSGDPPEQQFQRPFPEPAPGGGQRCRGRHRQAGGAIPGQ
jgi:hypothetical protein